MENKHNLSKQKTENHIGKAKNKAMSGEPSLSNDGLTKGDKSFTDHTATEADKGTGGKIKIKPYNPKFATTSKSDPSNGKLDGEQYLSDKLNKGDKKFTDHTAKDGDEKYGKNHQSSKGAKPVTKDHNLASDMGGVKTMTNKPSIKGKSTPSNNKLSSEDSLSDSFTYLMNFGQFVNEAYDEGEEETDDKKKEGEDEGEEDNEE
jgi:hypothetical protein